MEELDFEKGEPTKKKYKPVFTVIEREGAKKYYVRIGVAFVNHDASLTVKLDGYPTNGSLYIRDWKPWEIERMAQNAERTASAGGAP